MKRGQTRPNSLDRRVGRLADWLGFALLWGWIITSSLFVPAWLGFPTVGIVLSLITLVVCWQAAEASTHPVYTIGTRREVERARIDDHGYECDECGRPARGGERRRYSTRRVLFGTTVAVPEWGVNDYCEECAVDPDSAFAHEPVTDSSKHESREPTLETDDV